MICPNDQLLHHFHDGELSPDERSVVAEHLQSCDACAAKLQELRLLGEMIRSAPLPQLAASTLDRWQRNAMVMQERSVIATASQAQALPPAVSEWEAAVIGIDVETVSTDITTAQWIATDLARTQGGGLR
jgi:anti-sigma factor RsiW